MSSASPSRPRPPKMVTGGSKKVHRLWREEGLQVREHHPRKRAGIVSVRPVEADAPKVVWALDFQFDSTVERRAVKIASMIDEHTRESLLHMLERSITAERLVDELQKAFTAAGGPPRVLRMYNGPEMISHALQRFCADRVGISYIPPGTLEQRVRRIVQPAAADRMPEPEPLDQPARSPSGDRRLQDRPQPPAPAFGAGLPHAGRVRCGLHPHPPSRGLRDQLNTVRNHLALLPG
jgi:hypothetical protein